MHILNVTFNNIYSLYSLYISNIGLHLHRVSNEAAHKKNETAPNG